MKTHSLIIILLLLNLACTQHNKGILEVKDVTRDTTFKIKVNESNNYSFSYIDLHVVGNVDDSVQIDHLIFDGNNLDVKYRLDKYNGEVWLSYKARQPTGGNLKIYYDFPQIWTP